MSKNDPVAAQVWRCKQDGHLVSILSVRDTHVVLGGKLSGKVTRVRVDELSNRYTLVSEPPWAKKWTRKEIAKMAEPVTIQKPCVREMP